MNPLVDAVNSIEPTDRGDDLCIEGFHHLAFIADRMAETHRFWTEIVGLRFSWAITNVYVPSTGLYSPHMHVFYELAEQGNVAYFAIQRETLDPGTNWQDHPARNCSLQARRNEDLPLWKQRLEQAGVAVREDIEADGRLSLAFRDPEGLPWKISAPARTYDGHDAQTAQALVENWINRERQEGRPARWRRIDASCTRLRASPPRRLGRRSS